MADDCSNPSDSDSPDALPGDDDQNAKFSAFIDCRENFGG